MYIATALLLALSVMLHEILFLVVNKLFFIFNLSFLPKYNNNSEDINSFVIFLLFSPLFFDWRSDYSMLLYDNNNKKEMILLRVYTLVGKQKIKQL